jgi:hypothetical protein
MCRTNRMGLTTSVYFRTIHANKLNSVSLVRKRTVTTERPPHINEVSANFLRIEGVARSAQRILTAVNLGFLDPKPLLFHSSSSSIIFKREWTPFQTHYFLEDLVTQGSIAKNSDHKTTETDLHANNARYK